MFTDSAQKIQISDDSSIDYAGSKYLKSFKIGFETTWSAAIISLDDMLLEKIDKEDGIIRTEWIEGLSMKKARGVLTNKFMDDHWKERFRVIVSVSGNEMVSNVSVCAQIQEKRRGGSAAYRWERKRSTGMREGEILKRIEDVLCKRE
ncbi:MAG: hypothetical protein A3G70_04715 [Planctomycetes bacterium RIFCSPLOWO2_12_FULL_39_13]|nr:MAG: hypothetical protein A3G70_04715 [Planctomycetes bacterium RIFCSPLOWO2_12_FULL_39_13]